MTRLKWHQFAGGTRTTAEYGYSAHTGRLNGREMYTIDSVPNRSGAHMYYNLAYFGPGGWTSLGTAHRAAMLKTKAQAHYNEMNPPAARKPLVKKKRAATRESLGFRYMPNVERKAFRDPDRPWAVFKNKNDATPFAFFKLKQDADDFAQDYADKHGKAVYVEKTG